MTKSTITRERIQRIIRAIDSESYDEEEIREWLTSDEIMELARMALAAMDSEPVAYTDEAELCFVNDMACMWIKGMGINEVPLYRHAQPAPASPVCTCPSGDGSLRWPCPVHAGNSLVIPDGSASMLRRWLAFGRAMQNAGCQLPHNLIAETEAMLAAATQEAINALIPLVSRNEQEGK
ncbi:hypothetical protein [Klebsiella pneumoniae]|uniref:hypothetical protein n=1 Tax=Klebsiella pneumoniae TaxID=573 RepID=UPI001C66BB48|nr:hypothetical protein [Klebsiella pneumoniae]